MEGAAVRPGVVEGHVLDVNGTDLNVAVLGALPLQTLAEVLVEDKGGGVVVVENLQRNRTFSWVEGPVQSVCVCGGELCWTHMSELVLVEGSEVPVHRGPRWNFFSLLTGDAAEQESFPRHGFGPGVHLSAAAETRRHFGQNRVNQTCPD